jgi:hypothetical protein
MSDEEKDILIESLARELPRRSPGAETIMKISEAIHGEAKPARRTEFGPVMDMEELAEFLRVDAGTVGEYLDQIPCFELGGKLLFRRKSVEEWIAARERTVAVQGLRVEFDRPVLPAGAPAGGRRWTL